MPFAATWTDLEIIILTEVSLKERQIYDITSVWNLKYNTNECIYETETNSQTQRTDLGLRGVVAEGQTGSLGLAGANYYIQDE